jgi:hypothetical protein
MPPLIAAAVAAAFPATLATVGGAVGGVTYASVIGSVLFTAASVALMYALAPKPPKQTVKTMIKVPDAPRFTVYGTEVQLGGVCVMYVAKPKGRLLWIVTVTGDGPIGGFSFFKLNGKLVELAPDGNVKTRPYNLRDNAGRDSRARIWTRNGTDTQTSTRDDPASSTETAHLGIDWTSDHRLRGISYAMTEFLVCKDAKAQSAVFPSGVPEQKYGIIGRAVWDFRDPGHRDDLARQQQPGADPRRLPAPAGGERRAVDPAGEDRPALAHHHGGPLRRADRAERRGDDPALRVPGHPGLSDPVRRRPRDDRRDLRRADLSDRRGQARLSHWRAADDPRPPHLLDRRRVDHRLPRHAAGCRPGQRLQHRQAEVHLAEPRVRVPALPGLARGGVDRLRRPRAAGSA